MERSVMWVEVDYLVTNVEKSDQDELMGTDLHKDKHYFKRGLLETDSVMGMLQDGAETVWLNSAGLDVYIKYDIEVIELILGSVEFKML